MLSSYQRRHLMTSSAEKSIFEMKSKMHVGARVLDYSRI